MARPKLTITEAAEAAGVHRNTVRRAVDKGRFPGAEQVGEGGQTVWRIPVEDLLAHGFVLHQGGVARQAPGAPTELPPEMVDENIALRERVVRLERDLDVQRAVATERERTIGILVDQLAVMRELMPAPVDVEEMASGRRWWPFGGS
jgi:excisionase family DNA binding protein